MPDPQLPSVPPSTPPVTWRQHFGQLWQEKRSDVIKAAVVIAVPALIGGAVLGGRKLLAWWKSRR